MMMLETGAARERCGQSIQTHTQRPVAAGDQNHHLVAVKPQVATHMCFKMIFL